MIEQYKPTRPLLLASCSPRRKEILSLMGFEFKTVAPQVGDELSYLNRDDPVGSLCSLARAKAESVACRYPHALVLGADTEVIKDRQVFGKPSDKSDAFEMLRKLSGTEHLVVSAVALVCEEINFSVSCAVKTDVFFRQLTDSEICSYLALNEYQDKAGGYAIQGKAMLFIEKIAGCFYNVVGLPVAATLDLLKQYTIRKESVDVRK